MDESHSTSSSADHQQIVEMIRTAMESRGLSQNDVAKQVDISASQLSSFLAGRYKGDNDEAARKLAAWHAGLAATDSIAGIMSRINRYAPTPTSQRIAAALDLAKAGGTMVSVAGMSGIGKSATLKHFAATSTAVWYCQFSEDTVSVYATLAEVAEAVGITELPRRPDLLRREIVKKIRDTRGLILCDEAQHLSAKGFEAIRTIHDRSGVGVALAGHMDLADKVARLPQLFGRMSAPIRIGGAKPEDVDALFDSWGFDCQRSRNFLRRYAGQATGLRRIARAYQLAASMASGAGQAMSFEYVQTGWAALQETVIAN